MGTLNVTLEAAEKALSRAIRQQRTQRKLPTVPPSLDAFSKANQVYIFNVGPWDHHVMLGSWGTYYIPKCDESAAFAAARPIPGIYHEPIPVDEGKFELAAIEGTFVAEQILGVGKNIAFQSSLMRLGVFMTKTVSMIKGVPVPAKEDLDVAREMLNEEFIRLFEEAELAYAQGPKQFQDMVGDGMKHKLAARRLNRVDVKWMRDAQVGKQMACPNCGTYSEPQVISCHGCRYIFDLDRYKKEIEPRLAKG